MSSVRVQRLAADDAKAHEAVVDVIRRGFLGREAICCSSRVADSPQAIQEMTDMVLAVLQDGVSVAAYLGDTMVGVAVNKIQVPTPPGGKPYFEAFMEERITDPQAQWFFEFLLRVDGMRDLFAEAGGAPLVECVCLGVLPDAGRRGVGLQLITKTVEVAKDIRAKGVCAIFTSNYSRAIGRRLGFQELLVAEHSDFTFQGKLMSASLPEHQKRSVLDLLKLEESMQ